MNHRRLRIAFLLLPWHFSAGAAGAESVVIALRPSMPAIEKPGVTPLNWARTAVPDADRTDPGLKLTLQTPFRWVVSPGDAFPVTVSSDRKDDSDKSVLTVWDWTGNAVVQRQFALPVAKAIEFTVADRGTYLLTLDRYAGTKHLSRLVRSFSVCPPNQGRRKLWDLNRFFVGACSFPDRQNWGSEYGKGHPEGLTPRESAELEAELSSRLGIQTVRLNSGPGDSNEWAFELYAAKGIRPYIQLWLPNVDVLPTYQNVTDPKWRYPRPEAPSRTHDADVAKRYGKRALFFEINNEPDNEDFWRGTPEEFIDLHRWAVEEIRREAPGAILANGGYCLIKPEWFAKYVEAFRGTTDWIAYHTHGALPACIEGFQAIRQAHEEAGSQHPVFVNTEMGHAAWRLDMERVQAYVTLQKILYFWAHDNRGVLLYNSRNIGGVRQGEGEADWGYLDHFFCPRFTYGAVAALLDWFAGTRFESVLREERQLHAYCFSAEGRRLVTVFDPTAKGPAQEITVRSDARTALSLDPMGNATPLADARRVRLKASAYPALVVLEGASGAALE
ncbi:MAG: hypothetical protein COZ57_15070 [Armatimonadetes bacterium CG_4_8_14_3_um_filter_66_20]|nr:MAG: hypothetical protein COZ57_15070 [Armatimonadetes bacterium CG_4_8_14_3_um_filter_66_20]